MHDLSPGYFLHLSGTTWTAGVSALGHLLQVPIEPDPDLWNQTRSLKVWTEGFLRHFLACECRLICHYRSSQCYLHLIQGKDCCEIYWCLAVILICVSWNYSPGMLPHQGHGKMQLPRRTSAVAHGTSGGVAYPQLSGGLHLSDSLVSGGFGQLNAVWKVFVNVWNERSSGWE